MASAFFSFLVMASPLAEDGWCQKLSPDALAFSLGTIMYLAVKAVGGQVEKLSEGTGGAGEVSPRHFLEALLGNVLCNLLLYVPERISLQTNIYFKAVF